MIKFFRRVRKQMLTENKLSKYLIYAIGEIVLVVIGILIALAINNNKEQNKLENEIVDYLSIIKNSIKTDIASATKIKNYRDSSQYYSSISLRNIINKELSMKDFEQVFSRKFNPAAGQVLSSNKNGFNALISSGLIAKLKNPEIRDSIFNYYKLIEELEKAEEGIYENLRYHNRELLLDAGSLELMKSFGRENFTDKQERWFKDFVSNSHLHSFHGINVGDRSLRKGYPDVIIRGDYIIKLVDSLIQ